MVVTIYMLRGYLSTSLYVSPRKLDKEVAGERRKKENTNMKFPYISHYAKQKAQARKVKSASLKKLSMRTNSSDMKISSETFKPRSRFFSQIGW